MSAMFKNFKKNVSQRELRKLMSDHKNKLQKVVKKIDSPLAKYNETGQLTCVLCNSVVRSDAVWNVHVNSKQHREQVEFAKKLKERTDNFTKAPKRPQSPTPDVPQKKLKSILKNSTASEQKVENENVLNDENDSIKKLDESSRLNSLAEQAQLETTELAEVAESSTLPEGFFDDPKLDAKARNVEYKDPIEEEWERFQKEIRDADFESAAIIAEDEEEATNERQIIQIDEQIKNLSKVVNWEKKKVQVMSTTVNAEDDMEVDERSSVDEEDFDEFLDWRSKRSFK